VKNTKWSPRSTVPGLLSKSTIALFIYYTSVPTATEARTEVK